MANWDILKYLRTSNSHDVWLAHQWIKNTSAGSIHFFRSLLVLVNLMWAFQFSGAKIATERLGPIAVALIPLALSTALFAPLVRMSRGKKPGPRWTPVVWRDLFLASTLGIIPAQLGLTWGVEHSLASTAAVLTLAIPVLTAIMAGQMIA